MAETPTDDRAQRILDAAAALIVRFGYDKTTVSDIAREAGVSKGAVYLHFDSKDDLFEALMIGQMKTFSEAWIAAVLKDPMGGTIGGMYKAMLLALDASPFMAAMLTRDAQVFGNYAKKPDNFFRRSEAGRSQGTRHEFVALMQSVGAMREDVDPRVTAHIMNIISFGLVGARDLIPPDQVPGTAPLIEGIADMMDRAFTPPGADLTAVSARGKAVLLEIFEGANARYNAMAQGKEEDAP